MTQNCLLAAVLMMRTIAFALAVNVAIPIGLNVGIVVVKEVKMERN